nr:MAG TPA: ribosome, tRNA, helicase, RIBOSOME [Caudoviricetes sp.]
MILACHPFFLSPRIMQKAWICLSIWLSMLYIFYL